MTDNPQKDKLKAAGLTVAIHLGLLLILFFASMNFNLAQRPEEEGVPVMLGYMPEASSDEEGGSTQPGSNTDALTPEEDISEPIQQPAEPVTTTSPTPVKETKAPEAKEPLLTSKTNDKSIAADEAKKKAEAEAKKKAEVEAKKKAEAEAEAKKKAEAEAKKKAEAERLKAEAEAKRKAEEARKKAEAEAAAKANEKVGGAFGKARGNGNRGDTSGEGVKGTETGNAPQGSTTGVGGTGTEARVGNRKALYLAKPAYTDNTSSGTVVVNIVVNKEGKVTSATVKSGTTSAALRNAALDAARKSTFSAGTNNAESGTITYKFKLN
ncbi:MAG: cell envelope integrity protein TolA [Bacteroidaceae bacterium]|nr:cell envelope integrity protein TolA [Bacteroidaceae bacterium]